VTTTTAPSPPSAADLAAVAGARVLFGHKSVGANLLGGIAPLYQAAGVPAPRVVEAREPVDTTTPFLAHTHVGQNRDPLGKLKDFEGLLDGPLGEAVDVALVKLCYADVDAGTDVEGLFRRYTETMDGIAARHPGLRLVYTTVPLTTDRSWKARVKAALGSGDRRGPADNLARHRYNTLVRERYGQTGRLFDIAAVEATLDGPAMVRRLDGREYHVLNRDLSSDAGHLNPRGARAAAAEFVRVVAASARP
jgi:hypothetical protein